MQCIYNITSDLISQNAATIGFFDGVHSGHRFLIEQVKHIAQARGIKTGIVTFSDHPRKAVHPDTEMKLLTTLEEKVELLQQIGVDYCFILDFTKELSQMSARDFMEQILHKHYGVDGLLIGYDHRFGHNRSENFADYKVYGKEIGMEIIQAQAYQLGDIAISSSIIRNKLLEGDITNANRYLGYEYFLHGEVTDGYKLGRKLGFPTANLKVHADKLIPGRGVYAVRVQLGENILPGMLNIGYRPTINNGEELSIEVHILHFEGNLYHQNIKLSFIKQLRKEIRFDNIEQLIEQLKKDKQHAEQAFENNQFTSSY